MALAHIFFPPKKNFFVDSCLCRCAIIFLTNETTTFNKKNKIPLDFAKKNPVNQNVNVRTKTEFKMKNGVDVDIGRFFLVYKFYQSAT